MSTIERTAASGTADGAYRQLVWLTVALFLSYLCVAMALPAVPVHVTTRLGFGNAWAGFGVGIAFVSTILTRGLAGRMADRRGGKLTMIWGLAIYAAAGLVCAASSWEGFPVVVSYAGLLLGRLLLGVGESLGLVGVVAWALGLMGPRRSGQVFNLIGMGLFGAFAAGGPLGVFLLDQVGFRGVMAACTLVPLVGLLMVLPVPAVTPIPGERASFLSVLGRIWEPGLVVGFQGVGFAAIGAFMPLLFISRAWPHPGLGLSCFGVAFVLVRVLLGHLPDRLGSVRVATASLAVEAAGLYLLWAATGPELALAGAFLTGLGCSLIFPSMGIEVVRRVPPHLRGTASGGFAMFQDLAYAVTGPVTGLLADRFGYSVVFLIGGLAATVALALVGLIARERAPVA